MRQHCRVRDRVALATTISACRGATSRLSLVTNKMSTTELPPRFPCIVSPPYLGDSDRASGAVARAWRSRIQTTNAVAPAVLTCARLRDSTSHGVEWTANSKSKPPAMPRDSHCYAYIQPGLKEIRNVQLQAGYVNPCLSATFCPV